jgi:hypothetical protein
MSFISDAVAIINEAREATKTWSAETRMLAVVVVLFFLVGGAAGGYSWRNREMNRQVEMMKTSHDAQVNALKDTIGSKDAVILAKDNDLSAKSGEIARLSTAVATSEMRASAVETVLATRDLSITGLNDQIAALSTRLTEQRLTPTATMTPTPTPVPSPITSSDSTPGQTPLITITTTVTPELAQAALPPIGSDCDASLLEIVNRANSAWVGLVQETTTQTELDATWGEASQEARNKADELKRNLKAWNASLEDVKYELRGCKVINHIGDKKVVIETSETWEYSASLTCGNVKVMDKLVEDYTQQNYRLLIDSDGWRLISWETGNRTVIDSWQCKR